MGGNGKDSIDGGPGKDKESSGNSNSSSLRAAVAARLVNWKETFKGFGLPYNPFGGLHLRNGSSHGSFDFLTFDSHCGGEDDD